MSVIDARHRFPWIHQFVIRPGEEAAFKRAKRTADERDFYKILLHRRFGVPRNELKQLFEQYLIDLEEQNAILDAMQAEEDDERD